MIDKKSSKKIDFGKNFQITNCWKSNSMPNDYKLNRVNSEWTIAVITSGNMKLNNSGQILTENDIIIFPPNEKQDIVENKPNFYYEKRPLQTMLKMAKKLSKIKNVTIGILSN